MLPQGHQEKDSNLHWVGCYHVEVEEVSHPFLAETPEDNETVVGVDTGLSGRIEAGHKIWH